MELSQNPTLKFLVFMICFVFNGCFIFNICFAPKTYGYPDFSDQIETNNESNQI